MTELPALPPFSPLALILTDIGKAIDAQLYYPALLMALTVPEICAALAMERSVFVKEKHYAGFVDRYTTKASLGLAGIDCYRLRGGLVHRGNLAGHPKADWTNTVFTIPETGTSIHALTLKAGDKSAAAFDLKTFCSEMVSAAYKWYEDHKDHALVAKNMPDLIRYCPSGLPPFVGGAPVVGSGP